MFNIVITIILSLLFILFILFLIKEKRLFLKNSSIFYIPLLIILFVIHIYGIEENHLLILSFESLKNTIESVAFKGGLSIFNPEIANENLFIINYYVLLLFISYITFSCVIDLVFNNVINYTKSVFIRRDSVVVIMESSEEAKIFLNTLKRKYVIIDKKDTELEKYFLDKKICYLVGINEKNIYKFKDKSKIVSFLNLPDNQLKAIKLLTDLNNNQIYFKAENDIRFALDEMIKNKSNISLFNKHELIADEFIINNSISKYLDDTMIDRKTLLLNDDIDIKTFMIGFGRVNSSIYLELIKNNQYAKLIDNKISTYKVDYYIYNKEEIDKSNLNHNLRRIRYIDNKDDYYAWPDETFKVNKNIIDINSFEYYSSIKSNLALKGLNIFVIGLGNDLRDLDMALKLNDRINSWNLESKSIIFVRVKDDITNEFDLPSNVIPFGSDKKILTHDVIINDEMLEIAKRRAALYSKTEDIEGNWKSLPLAKRLSNKNAVFSIIHKMGLLGLEVVPNNKLSKEQYYEIYDIDNEIEYKDNKIVYPLKFSKTINPRNTLAYLEHNRWNTEMITKGYIPMEKSKVYVDKTKIIKDDLDKKLHACITTFDGLDLYFDDVALKLQKQNNISYDEAYSMVENKKYDYEMMDEAYDLLKKIGYGIKIV
ncbi:MAG: hypothetical protein IJA65_06035 [Acholeplasmatales bacterium]|nr:hypothetical protein [Acholeplasmatales bacterium]